MDCFKKKKKEEGQAVHGVEIFVERMDLNDLSSVVGTANFHRKLDSQGPFTKKYPIKVRGPAHRLRGTSPRLSQFWREAASISRISSVVRSISAAALFSAQAVQFCGAGSARSRASSPTAMRGRIPRRGAPFFRKFLEQIDHCPIGHPRFFGEPGDQFARIAVRNLAFFVHFSGQKALAERAEGHEANAESSIVGMISCPCLTRGLKGIFALQRRDRLYGVRPTDGLCARFRQAKMLDFPRLDQVFHRPGHVLDRYFGAHVVLVKKVDCLHPKAF